MGVCENQSSLFKFLPTSMQKIKKREEESGKFKSSCEVTEKLHDPQVL